MALYQHKNIKAYAISVFILCLIVSIFTTKNISAQNKASNSKISNESESSYNAFALKKYRELKKKLTEKYSPKNTSDKNKVLDENSLTKLPIHQQEKLLEKMLADPMIENVFSAFRSKNKNSIVSPSFEDKKNTQRQISTKIKNQSSQNTPFSQGEAPSQQYPIRISGSFTLYEKLAELPATMNVFIIIHNEIHTHTITLNSWKTINNTAQSSFSRTLYIAEKAPEISISLDFLNNDINLNIPTNGKTYTEEAINLSGSDNDYFFADFSLTVTQ